ncbi:MAG: 16S rRNA (cytidine(1402)-2'-O)-methyltransferase [Actinomycetota bacterium]
MSGSLVLIATPIGNMGDLSQRALDALATCDALCCEDTRRTGLMLNNLGLSGKTYIVVNEHTEHDATNDVVERLLAGQTVGLVTDAGTPGISDPGERLVRAAIDKSIPVTAIPGPAAVVMALVVSGLSTSRFVFEGFIPRNGQERASRIAEIADERRTVVIYEAPHRLERTLADLEVACGPLRHVVVARELTKLHEEIRRATLHDAVQLARQHEPRGEYVVVIEGAAPPEPATEEQLEQALRRELANGLSKRDAAAMVAHSYGAPKRLVYELALRLT